MTEVDDDGNDDEDENLTLDEVDSSEDELQRRFDQMTFLVATRKVEQLPHWIKVTDVFKTDSDAGFLKRAGVNSFDDPNYERYSQRLARLRGIRKYVYRMDVLERRLKYDEVTEIFVRVNSLGAKLRSSDLALAQITAKWRNSLKTFEAFQKQCDKLGFELDLGIHLKNLRGMEFALNFLKSNVGIDSPALLSSPFIAITVAYFGHKRRYDLSPRESEGLRHWVLIANAKGRYSRGSSEALLDQDIATLRDGGGSQELIDRLRQQVGRLDIVPEELEGRNQRSALFKTMFLAFREAGARDWRSQVAIALDHSGSHHRLQFHHIFPKAVLKGEYTGREADDIANLCFIGGKTNRQISDKPPERYLPEMIAKSGSAAFDSQCIPTETALLGIRGYKAFLQRRRTLVAERLNQFLSVKANTASAPNSIKSSSGGVSGM